jgi:WD40 repeat protein
VYELNVDSWVRRGQTLDGGGPDQFAGGRVVLSDDGSVVLYDIQITARQPGPIKFVRVFRYNGSTWEKVGQDVFGQVSSLADTFSIDFSGNGEIFVIASIVPGFGYAETYQLNGNTWELNGQVIPNSTTTDESVGITAAVNRDGSILAVGFRKFQTPNLVRVYEFDNGWIQLGNDIDTKGSSSDTLMTIALSLDGQTLAVGPQDDTKFASVHKFDNVNGQWAQVGEIIEADLRSGAQLQSIDLSDLGDRVAVFGLGGENVKVYDGVIATARTRRQKRIPIGDALP